MLVHGDGWIANWTGLRLIVGPAVLHGRLYATFEAIASREARIGGRVERIQVITETRERVGGDQTTYRSIPGMTQLRDVDVSPRTFADGLVPRPGLPRIGWHGLVPDDPYTREDGVLVDLDLDAAEECGVR